MSKYNLKPTTDRKPTNKARVRIAAMPTHDRKATNKNRPLVENMPTADTQPSNMNRPHPMHIPNPAHPSAYMTDPNYDPSWTDHGATLFGAEAGPSAKPLPFNNKTPRR